MITDLPPGWYPLFWIAIAVLFLFAARLILVDPIVHVLREILRRM